MDLRIRIRTKFSWIRNTVQNSDANIVSAGGLTLLYYQGWQALVRATRELVELIPAYRNLLLNTLMAGSVSADVLTLLYCQGWRGAGARYL